MCLAGTYGSGIVPERHLFGAAGLIIPRNVSVPSFFPSPSAPPVVRPQVDERKALNSVQWGTMPFGWGSGTPLSSWQGITVEGSNVVALELQGFELKGGETSFKSGKRHRFMLFCLCHSLVALNRLGLSRHQLPFLAVYCRNK